MTSIAVTRLAEKVDNQAAEGVLFAQRQDCHDYRNTDECSSDPQRKVQKDTAKPS